MVENDSTDENGREHETDGDDGQNGEDGDDGQNGEDGDDGQNGEDGNDGQNGEDGNDGQNGEDGNEQSSEPGFIEKIVIVFSIIVVVLFFGYAGFQTLGGPVSAPPEATVIGTDQLSNDSVAVHIRIHNPRDVGLVTATVESDCTSPPAQVQFSYLPADSTKTGTLVCPANTTSPNVSVSNWVEA